MDELNSILIFLIVWDTCRPVSWPYYSDCHFSSDQSETVLISTFILVGKPDILSGSSTSHASKYRPRPFFFFAYSLLPYSSARLVFLEASHDDSSVSVVTLFMLSLYLSQRAFSNSFCPAITPSSFDFPTWYRLYR